MHPTGRDAHNHNSSRAPVGGEMPWISLTSTRLSCKKMASRWFVPLLWDGSLGGKDRSETQNWEVFLPPKNDSEELHFFLPAMRPNRVGCTRLGEKLTITNRAERLSAERCPGFHRLPHVPMQKDSFPMVCLTALERPPRRERQK